MIHCSEWRVRSSCCHYAGQPCWSALGHHPSSANGRLLEPFLCGRLAAGYRTSYPKVRPQSCARRCGSDLVARARCWRGSECVATTAGCSTGPSAKPKATRSPIDNLSRRSSVPLDALGKRAAVAVPVCPVHRARASRAAELASLGAIAELPARPVARPGTLVVVVAKGGRNVDPLCHGRKC